MNFSDQDFEAVYPISVAAKLAGMHPQTLRQYDRLGLVVPQRTKGRGRRYSSVDIASLREVQRLSKKEGINLAGIKHIMILRRQLLQVEAENRRLKMAFLKFQQSQKRVFTAGPAGEIAQLPSATSAVKNSKSDMVHYPVNRDIVRL